MRYKLGNKARVHPLLKLFFGVIPFILLAYTYVHFSEARLAENPRDKVLPSVEKIYTSFSKYIAKEDRRTGKLQFIEDIKSSMKAIFIGIAISVVLASLFGVMIGTFPVIDSFLSPITNATSSIPPAAIVAVLFLVARPGLELSLLFIFIALFFIMVKDISHQVKSISGNLTNLLFSKGASELEIAKENFYLVVPGILNSLKLNLPMVWFALLFSETLGAQDGLGTRIFILKRFSANEIIFPYILIITIIAVGLYYSLDFIVKKKYPWYAGSLSK